MIIMILIVISRGGPEETGAPRARRSANIGVTDNLTAAIYIYIYIYRNVCMYLYISLSIYIYTYLCSYMCNYLARHWAQEEEVPGSNPGND